MLKLLLNLKSLLFNKGIFIKLSWRLGYGHDSRQDKRPFSQAIEGTKANKKI